MRIQREGWSENQVHSVLSDFRALATYKIDIKDHWDTPKEFMHNGFAGNCVDIAAFMMGTMRRLNYPRPVRILVVRGTFEDHALLHVALPGNGWKVYDVTLPSVPSRESGVIRRIVEYDEKMVTWFPPQKVASSATTPAQARVAESSEGTGTHNLTFP